MTTKALVSIVGFVGVLVCQKYFKARKSKEDTSNQVNTVRNISKCGKKKDLEAIKVPPEEKNFIVEIEYCTGCRWMLRSAWIAQELLTTFQEDLRSVQLTPNSTEGGIFQVYLHDVHQQDDPNANVTLWSRKTSQRFPELKELKQIVRDFINIDKRLGHSDKK